MTEQVGYSGPIYMTAPTKAISKLLIEDMRRIMDEKKTETDLFTTQNINDCFNKISEITLHQTIEIDDIKVKAYYAGHVLGAVMFYVEVGGCSVVYTGDYNMTSDSHLGGAWIDRCEPDVLITESTYATTIRESRRSRENDMLNKVHKIVSNGGKVLIPVFALGRAQEICLLLERFWETKNLEVPIYMSTGMAEKAVHYYKMFIGWTNQNIKGSFYKQNLFEFKRTLPLDRTVIDEPGPMVVLASPGMLHAGMSCYVFKKWANDPNNGLLMPGYCAIGTLGQKVLSGQTKIECEDNPGEIIEVRLQVLNMSFSAHADSNGILQLIDYCRPKNAIVLVHGEFEGMKIISEAIQDQFELDCYFPANGEILKIPICEPNIKALIPMNTISHLKSSAGHRFIGSLQCVNHEKYPLRITNLEDDSNDNTSIIYSTSLKLKIDSCLLDSSQGFNSILKNISSKIKQEFPSLVITYIDPTSFFINTFMLILSKDVETNFLSVSLKWNCVDNVIADDLIKILQSSCNYITA